MRRRFLTLLAVLVAASGCSLGADPAPSPQAERTPPPTAGEPMPPNPRAGEAGWRFVSGHGPEGEIPAGNGKLFVDLRPRRIAGFAGCNGFSIRARIRGDRVRVRGPVTSTLKGCGPEVAAVEEAYTSALLRVERRGVSGTRLVLSGPSTELVFESITPLDPAALTGRTWVLESVGAAGRTKPALRPETTLRFTAEGRIEGETACRDFAGRYVVRGIQLVITRLAMDRVGRSGCSPEAVAEEEALLRVFESPAAKVDGDRLVLAALGDPSAVYRAA